jgi:hypothetical protein
MISIDKVERPNQETAELTGYSTHLAVVLSLVFSLAAVVIISKHHITNLWGGAAAFAVPLPIALYFRNRIVLVGAFAYSAALLLTLGAAVIFGV